MAGPRPKAFPEGFCKAPIVGWRNRRWFVLEEIISVSLRFPWPFAKWALMPRWAGQCGYMQHSSCAPMAPCCAISSLKMGLRNSWRHRTYMSQRKHVIAFARSMYDLDDSWRIEMHSSAALMAPCYAISSLHMVLRNSWRHSTYVSQRKDVITFQVCSIWTINKGSTWSPVRHCAAAVDVICQFA